MTAFLLLLLASGCKKSLRDYGEVEYSGGDGGASGAPSRGGQAGSEGTPLTDPPSVLSVLPEDGATGVESSAEIVFTFSRPMDKVATQTAYTSADEAIKPTNVSFSWDADGLVLTIVPHEELPYREVADPDDAAESLTFGLTTAARSRDHQELSEPMEFSFSTLKRVHQVLTPSSERQLAGTIKREEVTPINYVLEDVPTVPEADLTFSAGRDGNDDVEGNKRGLTTFSLEKIPDGVFLDAVQLRFVLTSYLGRGLGRYPDMGGWMMLEVVSFERLGTTSVELEKAFESEASWAHVLTDPGDYEVDLKNQIQPVLDDDQKQIQFRLRSPEANDTLLTLYVEPKLHIEYLHP